MTTNIGEKGETKLWKAKTQKNTPYKKARDSKA
jgi:hypothetical protein